jgi:S-formylglutathione hydrolase FrmB
MGALLYEKAYPHDVTGLVLMAPYMGEPALVKAVADAGGPGHWDPGPAPDKVDSQDYQHELWHLVKSWGGRPEEARRIWLVCGVDDRFIEAARMIATTLPPEHFMQVAGGHDWPFWDVGAEQAFARIAAGHR